jgi:hypothetical protein
MISLALNWSLVENRLLYVKEIFIAAKNGRAEEHIIDRLDQRYC